MILKIIKVNTGIDIITNTYIILDEDKKEAAIIDPGGEANKIKDMIVSLDAQIKYIIITHCHYDHIGALYELKQYTNAKILISRIGSEGLNDPNINLSRFLGKDLQNIEADSRVDDGDLIHIGELEFQILDTPGHTKGGICLYCEREKLVFSGDTMFAGTWGRTDLPTGNILEIMNSINNKLLILPDDTVVYPGHGRPTTVGDEKVIYNELKETEI